MLTKYFVLLTTFILIINFSSNSRLKNKINAKTSSNDHFEKTCSNLKLTASFLSANCERNDGTENFTIIDLNNCINNEDGNLRNYSNRFYDTCKSCKLSPTTICCKCRRDDLSLSYTCLDLTQFVDNDDGNLKC